MKKNTGTFTYAALTAALMLSLCACAGKPAETSAAAAPTGEAETTAAETTTTAPETTVTETSAAVSGTTEAAGETTAETAEAFAVELSNGMKLSIPEKYKDLLVIDTPDNSPEGVLISVSEKASIEAAAKTSSETDGAGWLFGISCITEDALHDRLCYDMSGEEVFAKDEDGGFYMFLHPTDVRVVREENQYSNETMKAWSELCEWADSAKETFLADNPDLSPEYRGNSPVESYLARTAYMEDVNYTVSTLEYGPLEPNGVDPKPYVKRLTENAVYELVTDEEAPDGEYAVLNFPDDDTRFDFFFMEGKENYVREVWSDGQNEELYHVEFQDPSVKASAIMQEWYDAIAASRDMAALEYTPDALIGSWAEKVAGRGVIEISKGADDTYEIQINWGDSANTMYVWNMTATPDGSNGLRYENGRSAILTFDEKGNETEEVRYENGTGRFYLNSANEVMWEDETDHQGDDCVFVSTN
ncbi:MAG: hypothetical protein IJ061_07015 [Lachnospiraceae bacterium]|nr:hypothetical protein [Lachnospiraceae bacterium]